MKLYLLRHGRAVEPADWEGPEAERPLTGDGAAEFSRSARRLAAFMGRPERVVSSPYARAAATARLLSEALGAGEPALDPRLEPGFGPEDFRAIMAAFPEASSLVLVGHEPDLSRLAGGLSGGSAIVLKKGGLIRMDFDPASGRAALDWLLPPAALR